MGKVVLELSISLDGYACGPDIGPDAPLGRGGERLHEWLFAGKSEARAREDELAHYASVGAVILGRTMADVGIELWGEDPAFRAPVFVVTHRPAETIVREGGTSYVFVTGGISDALARARSAAGSSDVLVNGGPDIGRQFLAGGLLDELWLHLVPVVLGAGGRLFDGVSRDVALTAREARTEPGVTHLVYGVGG